MHAAVLPLGGGVSSYDARRLRGQSTIEYVLLIAIIGLVVVFAGPPVAGAIRNQFNKIATTLNMMNASGTPSHGGSSGSGGDTLPAAVQSALEKDAKDWTLDEQAAAGVDIGAKGEASPVYAKAKAAMDVDTKWTIALTDGSTMTYRIIGINHDDFADGSGKAGLTFLATSTNITSRMNATSTNVGGWEKSELRQKMNSGEIWNLMPNDLQNKVKAVKKLTNNVNGIDKNAVVTATSDKLFLLSYSEVVTDSYWTSSYPWTANEGTQYEAFKGKVVNNHSVNAAIAIGIGWWGRSANPGSSNYFGGVNRSGDPSLGDYAANVNCVCPSFCF